MGWYKRWADTNVCTFATISHSEISVEETEQKIIADIERMGGVIIKKHHINRWKYFPHVSLKVIQNGFYEKLESYREQNNT